MSRVPEMLRECATVYEERNKLYGDNYKWFGKVMIGLFPNGLTINNVDDWNRLGVFVQAVSKMTRYARNFQDGGHDDSALDNSVYMQMLRELDEEQRKFAEMMNGGPGKVEGASL